MAAQVCVVGSVNMDLVATTAVLPRPGETVPGTSFATHPGGKGANQAVAAARAGATVSFVGCVGDDVFGQELRAGLEHEGIDTTHLRTGSQLPSGVAMITVAADGQNSIIVAPGANATLSVADVEAAAAIISGARVLLLQLETPLATALAAARIAREAGVQVVLNPAPAQPLPASLLRLCDVIVPNESEAAVLSGRPVHDLASARAAGEALIAQGAQRVMITMGGHGALLIEASADVHVPAFAVRVVDTTAAGDALLGAFAAARAEGATMLSALWAGVAAGALATTAHGAQPALPDRRDIQALLSAATT